jgi:predicted dehydrogenase
VATLYAQSNHILQADKVDVETGGLVMLQYVNGLFATIDSSWSKPLNYPTWGGLTMELVSERGLTVVDAFSQNLNIYQQEPPSNHWAYWGSDMNQAMIDEFVAAIREGRETAVTGEDGLFALELVLAAYKSAESNQPERLMTGE